MADKSIPSTAPMAVDVVSVPELIDSPAASGSIVG
jgi:hypothetical protein